MAIGPLVEGHNKIAFQTKSKIKNIITLQAKLKIALQTKSKVKNIIALQTKLKIVLKTNFKITLQLN